MMKDLTQLFAWLRKNEGHISTIVFVGGTTTDILTLSKVSISYGILLLGIYTAVAVVASIAEHYLYIHEAIEGPFLRGLRLMLAFVAEFMIGCLLSGFLVLYSRSAAITVSWPFVLLLVIILFGNEFLRNYKERLAFRSTLIFFTIYAYTVFTLPTLLHHIGPDSFLESSLVTIAAFVLFMVALAWAGWKRLRVSMVEIVSGVIAVLVLVNVSYFTGIIPPLPLSLQDVGVYHSVEAVSGGYTVLSEQEAKAWWDVFGLKPVEVHLVQGTPLFVYSSIFAPVAFSTPVIHRWEVYNVPTHTWLTKAQIAFNIQGGRNSGYRGYSQLSNIVPGTYRVSIETLSGQVIGRTYFNVVFVGNEPVEQTLTK